MGPEGRLWRQINVAESWSIIGFVDDGMNLIAGLLKAVMYEKINYKRSWTVWWEEGNGYCRLYYYVNDSCSPAFPIKSVIVEIWNIVRVFHGSNNMWEVWAIFIMLKKNPFTCSRKRFSNLPEAWTTSTLPEAEDNLNLSLLKSGFKTFAKKLFAVPFFVLKKGAASSSHYFKLITSNSLLLHLKCQYGAVSNANMEPYQMRVWLTITVHIFSHLKTQY